jgi:tetratricopeptide (TPR) repeat protein
MSRWSIVGTPIGSRIGAAIAIAIGALWVPSRSIAQTQTPGQEVARLTNAAQAAYEKKDYQKSLDLYLEILNKKDLADSLSSKGVIYYNIACVRSLLGQKDSALEDLARSFKEGFQDVESARKDADFTAIRDDPRFAKTLQDASSSAAKAAGSGSASSGFESVKLDFDYKTIDGEAFDWGTVKGKVVALVIGGTWHSQFKKAGPLIQKYLDEHKAKDFTVVSLQFELLPIDEDNIKDAKDYREEHKITWPMLYAGDFDKMSEGVPFVKEEQRNKHPIIVFFDRTGKPRQMLYGSFDEAAFTRAADALLAQAK